MRGAWVMAALLVGCAGANKYTVRPVSPDVKVEITPERVERGGYLVNSIGACGACHNGRPEGDIFENFDNYTSLLGGFVMENPAFKMKMWIPNITSHETGIGSWTDDEIIGLIGGNLLRVYEANWK